LPVATGGRTPGAAPRARGRSAPCTPQDGTWRPRRRGRVSAAAVRDGGLNRA